MPKLTKEELLELRKKYKPVQRKLKASSRAYVFSQNMKSLAGTSSNIVDRTARNLAEALEKINRISDELSDVNGEGIYPELTEEKLQELNQSYSQALKECDRMISGSGMSDRTRNSQKYKTYSEMATLTRKLLSSDLKYLETANAGLGNSLPEIISNARSVVLKADMVTFDKLGQAQSSRFPMTVVLPGGRKVKGLFTEKDDFDPIAEYNSLFDKLKVDPRLESFMDSLKLAPDSTDIPMLSSRYKAAGNDLMKTRMRRAPLDTMSFLCSITDQTKPMLRSKPGYAEAENLLKDPDIAEKIGNAYAENFMVPLARLEVNYTQGGIRNGNLDNKSAACSVVAALLGRSDLLANSVPVKMKRDGKLLEGTFMEFVDGMDLTRIGSDMNDPKNSPFYSLTVGKGISRRPVQKDIFDLEIMDYVFGNIDCHGGNVLYDIQKDTQNGGYYLNGIKRIDLDNTFIEKEVDDKGLHNMTSAKNMKVISSGMAERLQALTGETLKLALRNYMKSDVNPRGLSEKSVDMMISRLEEVKSLIDTRIKNPVKGKLMVVADQDWTSLMYTDLLPEIGYNDPQGTSISILSWISDKNGIRKDAEERENKNAQAQKNSKGLSLPEVGLNSESKAAKDVDYVKMEEQLRTVEQQLASVAKVWNGSQQYTDMHDKAKELLDLLHKHNEEPEKSDPSFDEKISESLLEFRDKAEAYFVRKRNQGQKAANNTNSMKRIAAANKAANFITKYDNRIEIKKEETKKAPKGPVR